MSGTSGKLASSLISRMATSAPLAWYNCTVSCPSPLNPPVTRTTLSYARNACVLEPWFLYFVHKNAKPEMTAVPATTMQDSSAMFWDIGEGVTQVNRERNMPNVRPPLFQMILAQRSGITHVFTFSREFVLENPKCKVEHTHAGRRWTLVLIYSLPRFCQMTCPIHTVW